MSTFKVNLRDVKDSVMPNLIFGDYDYKTPLDYLKAKSVSIVFPVNNHLEKDKVEKAKAWEKR